ncbi:hypothetical protein ACI3ER_12100 [Bacillus sp. Wb]
MTNLTINKLNGKYLEMMIGKEVELNQDLLNQNNRCLKKTGSVGKLISVSSNEAVVQFGKRNSKVNISSLEISNKEDYTAIKEAEKADQERKELAIEKIKESNEIRKQYNDQVIVKEGEDPMNVYLPLVPLEWADEYYTTDDELTEFIAHTEYIKEALESKIKENESLENNEEVKKEYINQVYTFVCGEVLQKIDENVKNKLIGLNFDLSILNSIAMKRIEAEGKPVINNIFKE